MKNYKKGTYSISDIPWLAIILGVGIIVLAITTTIVGDLRDDHSRPSDSIINESGFTWTNNTNLTLAHDEISVSSIYNCTTTTPGGSATYNALAYTVFSSEGKVLPVDNNTYAAPDGTAACINYSHIADDTYWNTTLSGQRGQMAIGNWFPIIGLVTGAIIILTTLYLLGFIRKG